MRQYEKTGILCSKDFQIPSEEQLKKGVAILECVQRLFRRHGHVEALQIRYDPAQISYQQLLDVYWRNIDPLDDGGQFCDRGHEYQSAIFYQNDDQKKLAEQSKVAVEKRLGHSVTTAIRAAAPFYAAEDYHQDYYRKNPVRYKYYRYTCGRDQSLEELWGAAQQARSAA